MNRGGGYLLLPGIIRRVSRDVNFAESRLLECHGANSSNMSTETSEPCEMFVTRGVIQDHHSVEEDWVLWSPFPLPLLGSLHSSASIPA